MKTKKSFPFMQMFISAAIGIIVLCPLRIYQYFNILEAETGFYSKTDFSVYVLYAVMLFVILFSVIAAFMNKKNLEMKKISLSPAAGAVAFAIGGVGFAFDAASCVKEYLSLGNNSYAGAQLNGLQLLNQNGGLIVLFEALFGIISAIYFFTLASGHASKKDIAPKLRLMALALPLWSVMRLLLKFKTKISFINVSDLFIGLFAIAFTMLFLLYFAQTMSEVDKGESYFKLYAYGIPAAVFSIICFLPRLILSVIGRDDLLCAEYGIEYCDILIPVMILIILISRSYNSKKQSKA